MKKIGLYFLSIILLWGCAQGQPENHSFAKLPEPKAGEKVAAFAGGCFWAMTEAMSELKGVNKVVAGYSGGTVKNPTYENVCTKTTGHAESVQIYYNPSVISYAQLVEAFFYAHDPTTIDRQGPDEGDDYRSAIFYRTPEEKATVEALIKKVNATHHYSNPIVTQVVPYKVLYPAEVYHQGYYRAHPESGYIASVSVPKVMKMRKAVPQLLKPEFAK
ncbi:peptide-methionine (S)-S-oxide reductase MsrA [Mucilaginibacter paludis]|uniref:Peptide methionine sulfoxide reductase MsrA n=1 Tax=Mucilaginibacter paludis DSM 18603 TaxID=714943 RepID=H1Y3C4_9SPHI|nr:peptide-methionine (S)-S-oxide reductase MsrA [Mucilaginibacter paludis]EHQ29279.1 Peptide methionine sulfoxide reductase msrA [Mucilaginibacter paludis DSM 18603]